jgi:hypothetical protein
LRLDPALDGIGGASESRGALARPDRSASTRLVDQAALFALSAARHCMSAKLMRHNKASRGAKRRQEAT